MSSDEEGQRKVDFMSSAVVVSGRWAGLPR